MTREEAINNIFKAFSNKSNPEYDDAKNMITLFGITAEELSEAGLSYENLRALENLME